MSVAAAGRVPMEMTLQQEEEREGEDLLAAIRNGQATHVVKRLLQNENLHPKYIVNALLIAVDKGHVLLVQTLLSSPSIDHCPKDGFKLAFLNAVRGGSPLVVRAFLDTPDRLELDSWLALTEAASHGHLAVIQEFLAKEDLARHYKPHLPRALWHAAERGHNAIVQALLAPLPRTLTRRAQLAWIFDPDVGGEFWMNDSLRIAAAGGHLEVVKTILSCPQIKKEAGVGQAILITVQRKHFDILTTLLGSNAVRSYFQKMPKEDFTKILLAATVDPLTFDPQSAGCLLNCKPFTDQIPGEMLTLLRNAVSSLANKGKENA